MAARMDTYSEDEWRIIISTSFSFKECLRKMGYQSQSGDTIKKFRERIEKFDIDTSHFTINIENKITRTIENVFCKDSTCDQRTLRRFYTNGNYSEYICSICEQKPFWKEKSLTLILDHIDGDNHNNELNNLRWVCPNCNSQLDTTGARNIKKPEKKYYCIDCGEEIAKSSVRCISCAHKLQMKCERPQRNELKDMIRIMPFTTIATKYGVSDNTIRKWCDSVGLPRKSSDIKMISDEIWLKI